MLYLSTFSKQSKEKISDIIYRFAMSGIQNIELTGGSLYYKRFLEDLKRLQKLFNLNYLIHNYFPPPEKDFVLNLSSSNTKVIEQSKKLIFEAIKLARVLKAPAYSMHAGFLVDLQLDEIGYGIKKKDSIEREVKINIFIQNYKKVKEFSKKNRIDLYIENNIYSLVNFKLFGGYRPFMLLDSKDYFELRQKLNFNLLLDIAHLYVTCNTLNLDFEKELYMLLPYAQYIHISEASEFSDDNFSIFENSIIFKIIKRYNILRKKYVVLESGDSIDKKIESYFLLMGLNYE